MRAANPGKITVGIVCLLSGLFAAPAAFAENSDAEVEAKLGQLAAILSPPSEFSVAGKKWVTVTTGAINRDLELTGWLLEEDKQQLLLMSFDGKMYRLRKPNPDEKREVFPTTADGLPILGAAKEPDFSIVWSMVEEDFDAISQRFLAKGLPAEEVYYDLATALKMSRNQVSFERDHVLSAARYASYAYARGRTQHAIDLYHHAVKTHHKYLSHRSADSHNLENLHTFIVHQVASNLRTSLIYGAHEGDPRDELLANWQKLASLPNHKYLEEATLMAEGYQQLITEDIAWEEPTPEALAQFTTEQNIDYWMYKLRDLDAGQVAQPGECNVVDAWNRPHGNDLPNPAKELVNLGVAAVPALIEHMDDFRPTRCKGHWRNYSSEGQRLLRYGDCCQQIFEAITRERIHERKSSTGYPTYDGAAHTCKAKAQAWWDEYQKRQQDGND